MNIEKFSSILVRSNITNTYVATAFFATLIYFTINSNLYTPIEILFGVVLSTIFFKGIANIMFSLVIILFNLKTQEDELAFDKLSTKVDGLLSDLSLQESKLKTLNSN
jgi:hypothetical protein